MSAHAIERLCFEVDVPTRALAAEVQERLSAFQSGPLASVIDDCLNAAAPGDAVLSLDRLVLDLGALTLDRLEADLETRIRAALTSELTTTTAATGAPSPAADETAPVAPTALRRLSRLLEFGVLHWAEAPTIGDDMDALVAAAIADAPDAVRELLRRIGKKPTVRLRLARQLRPETRKALVRLLAHEDAAAVIAIAGALARIQHVRPVVATDRRGFVETVWTTVLASLVDGHGATFDEGRFVETLLKALTRRYRLRREDLVSALRVRLPHIPGAARDLSALPTEQAATGDRPVSAGSPLMPRESLAAAISYLRDGIVPAGGALSSEASMAAFMQDMLAASPEALAAEIRSRGEAPGFRQRLRRLFVDEDIVRLLAHLDARTEPPPAETHEPGDTGRDGTGGPEAPADPNNDLDLLLHLLEHGDLPASGNGMLDRDAGEWLSSLLRDRENAVAAALRRIGEKPETATRLVRFFPWERLSGLVVALVPDYAGAVITYLLAGEKLAADPAVPGEIRTVQWEVVLARLLDPHAATFDYAAFATDASRRIAHRLGLDPDTFLDALSAAAAALSLDDERFVPLAEILSARTNGGTEPAGLVTMPTGDGRLTSATRPAGSVALSFEAAPVSQPVQEATDDPLFPLRRFLQYGSEPAGIGIAARIEALLDEPPAALRNMLRAAAGSPMARGRLVARLPDGLLGQIVVLLDEDASPALATIAALSGRACARVPGLTEAVWRAAAFGTLLAAIARPPPGGFDQADYVRALVREIAHARRLTYVGLLSRLTRASGHTAERLPPDLEGVLARLVAEAEADTPLEPGVPERETSHWPFGTEDADEGDPALPAGENVYLDNAGLVLLWPFLPRFFDILGLLEDGVFRDAGAAGRGVHLLQLLATGEVDAPEHRLVLNKLLCGITPAIPIEPLIEPTDAETRLVDEVLYGVTQNWTPLQNTSIDSLRETFLVRDGRLARRDDGAWALAVEARPFDMLLESLPWGMSTIRLGWMKEALYVQWR